MWPLQALRPILGTYEDIPAPDMNTGAREMVGRAAGLCAGRSRDGGPGLGLLGCGLHPLRLPQYKHRHQGLMCRAGCWAVGWSPGVASVTQCSAGTLGVSVGCFLGYSE